MKTITQQCPRCPNNEFEEIATMVKAGTEITFKTKDGDKKRKLHAGRYRVKCTLCGFIEVVVSRSPEQYPDRNEMQIPEKLTRVGKGKKNNNPL